MSCKRKTTTQLTLVSLILLCILSCKKEEILPHNAPIKNDLIEVPPKEIDPDRYLSNSLIVLESEKILRNLVLQSIQQLYLYPELADLHSNQAITRSGCPTSSLDATQKIVTLTYSDCNSSSSVNYSGIVTLTIDGTLGVTGTTVDIELSDDFTVGGDQDIDGFVKLEYDGISNDKYDLTEMEIDNNSTDPSTELRLSNSGQVAHFILIDVNGDDDTANPLTYLDNEVEFDPYLTVHCPNPDGISQTSLEISPLASKVKYSIVCGMPFDGQIELTESGTLHSSINFSYPNASAQGVCDNDFEVCYPDGLGLGGLECEASSF